MTPEELDNLGFQLSHDLKSSLRGICLGLESASQALEKGDCHGSSKLFEDGATP